MLVSSLWMGKTVRDTLPRTAYERTACYAVNDCATAVADR
jgi:hypothetical protein